MDILFYTIIIIIIFYVNIIIILDFEVVEVDILLVMTLEVLLSLVDIVPLEKLTEGWTELLSEVVEGTTLDKVVGARGFTILKSNTQVLL